MFSDEKKTFDKNVTNLLEPTLVKIVLNPEPIFLKLGWVHMPTPGLTFKGVRQNIGISKIRAFKFLRKK